MECVVKREKHVGSQDLRFMEIGPVNVEGRWERDACWYIIILEIIEGWYCKVIKNAFEACSYVCFPNLWLSPNSPSIYWCFRSRFLITMRSTFYPSNFLQLIKLQSRQHTRPPWPSRWGRIVLLSTRASNLHFHGGLKYYVSLFVAINLRPRCYVYSAFHLHLLTTIIIRSPDQNNVFSMSRPQFWNGKVGLRYQVGPLSPTPPTSLRTLSFRKNPSYSWDWSRPRNLSAETWIISPQVHGNLHTSKTLSIAPVVFSRRIFPEVISLFLESLVRMIYFHVQSPWFYDSMKVIRLLVRYVVYNYIETTLIA